MDDLISRQEAIDIERNATVDTNSSHFEAHQKFMQFMDDAEVSSFGRWQWANGFNTALTAVGIDLKKLPTIQPEPQWIPVSERLPSKEERKEWIDNNLDGIGYLYPCLVTRYSSINPDRTKNNPYVAKHYFDGEDFLNAGEEVCSEYIIAWMPLPEAYNPNK